MTRLEALLLTVGFASLIALPPGLAVVAPATSVVPFEKRERATLEPIGVEAVPETFEAWFRDHLGLRYPLVALRHRVKHSLFGESPTDSLVVGRDGWLFLADDYGLENWRGRDLFDAAELAAWEAMLSDLQRYANGLGAELLVVVAPSKPSVHPEKLPPSVTRAAPWTRTDQFVARLSEAGVPVLDLRAPLRAAALETDVYERFGTHWNGDGALIAYQEIVGALGLTALAPEALERTVTVGPGDLARMIHSGSDLSESKPRVKPRDPHARHSEVQSEDESRPRLFANVDDPDLPVAIAFRDSFATALVPLLAEHFRQSTWLWTRTADPDEIAAASPDFVIYEITERYLMASVPANLARPRMGPSEREPSDTSGPTPRAHPQRAFLPAADRTDANRQ